MHLIQQLEDLNKEIRGHFKLELDNASDESALLKLLCLLTQRNIELFMFGVKGGWPENSYVDIMKTAIRRQIDFGQKITLPFIKKIDPITDLWSYEPKKIDFDEIDKFWKKSFNFPSEVVQKVKNNASDYVHPKLSLKILNTLQPEDLAQRIYEDCGDKEACLNHFISKIDLTEEEREFLRMRTAELFSNDVQSMLNFSRLFLKLAQSFTKNFVR